MTDPLAGNPIKVIRKARELGVHNDCLVADAHGACGECAGLMSLVYDFFYGHLETTDEVLVAIADDLIEDRRVDVL